MSAAGSANRSECLTKLAAGELDALCVVDMFNEGIDVPAVDRVVMLRPTESPVVFLQQLGRGLRRHEGKERLTVIDFVGNHRLFLERIRRLLSLAPSPPSLRDYLESSAEPVLPDGCHRPRARAQADAAAVIAAWRSGSRARVPRTRAQPR